MRRVLTALALGLAAGAGLSALRRRTPEFDPERTERLRRQLEEARQRLREDLVRARGEKPVGKTVFRRGP